MILLSLSALVLGAGLHAQTQASPAPAAPTPATGVIAMVSLKPGVVISDVMKLVPDEVHGVVQLYLDGKIEQWYTRVDGKGGLIFLRCKTADEARAILGALPAVKAGYINVEYIPVGPYAPLGFLARSPPSTDRATPH